MRELRDGWHAFTSRRWLWMIVIQFGLVNALFIGAFNVVGPALAKAKLGGAGSWGLILAAQSAGAVLGAALMLRYRPRHLLRAASLGVPLLALPLLALAAPLAVALIAAAALLLCAMLWFPVHQEGVSLRAYGSAVAVSVLCALLAVLLTLRPALPALTLGVLVPAVLAAGRLYEGRFHSARLSRTLHLTLAPGWIAGLAAVCAALAALTALLVRLAAQAPAPFQVTSAPPPATARRHTEGMHAHHGDGQVPLTPSGPAREAG